jgi:hypothetical protein
MASAGHDLAFMRQKSVTAYPGTHCRTTHALCPRSRRVVLCLVFLTLFSQGAGPFSILLASTIVQDGHGMLPLLADSRTDFILIKAINFSAGFSVGILGYLAE